MVTYKQHPKLLITVYADVPAPNGIGPSAGTVLITKLDLILKTVPKIIILVIHESDYKIKFLMNKEYTIKSNEVK